MLMALRSWSERKTVVEVARPGRSAPLDRCRRRGDSTGKNAPGPAGRGGGLRPPARRAAADCRRRAACIAGNAADYARAGAGLLVSSAPYHAAPRDVAVSMRARCA